MSDKAWVYRIPALPMSWDDAPRVPEVPWKIVVFSDLRHAYDFVDNLEVWIRPACRPLPAAFLTRADEENFLHNFSTWCRRWGRLQEVEDPSSAAEVENPFDTNDVIVRLKEWLK